VYIPDHYCPNYRISQFEVLRRRVYETESCDLRKQVHLSGYAVSIAGEIERLYLSDSS
jgi:hypothetical protein